MQPLFPQVDNRVAIREAGALEPLVDLSHSKERRVARTAQQALKMLAINAENEAAIAEVSARPKGGYLFRSLLEYIPSPTYQPTR
jgi:hypothetical protein